MPRRRAAVSGSFYPSDPVVLRETLERLLPPTPKTRATATLTPHAGYAWSGAVAAAVFSRVLIPREVLLVSFNHRGIGAPVALWPDGSWETPLGDIPVEEDLARRIGRLRDVETDLTAFDHEHSGEVQLPMLRHLRPDVRVVPLSIQTRDPVRIAGLAAGLEGILRGREILVAATTDLTHCGPHYGIPPAPGTTPGEFTRREDARVLECIAALDISRFWDTIARHRVSMCGVAPTAFMIEYARARGATAATIVKYATSADADTGADTAVGYPGVIV